MNESLLKLERQTILTLERENEKQYMVHTPSQLLIVSTYRALEQLLRKKEEEEKETQRNILPAWIKSWN